MIEMGLARVLHVVGVVLWIGGVAMVTTVILPAVKRLASADDRIALFESIEHRFAWQARVTTLVTGLSGFYMIHRLNAWERFTLPSFWWMHAMVLVWVLFTLMLFVLEPLVLRRLFLHQAATNPQRVFAVMQFMHWVLLMLSLLTVAGAVAGSHGWFWW
ncbi:MAG TPA: hypothetical protein PKZ35_17700 [Gammaproteobacteria bacterium]|jgi:uncharacterized membrane protein|nr:hypothetical protein [Gammaproteobacteria bacterium]